MLKDTINKIKRQVAGWKEKYNKFLQIYGKTTQ